MKSVTFIQRLEVFINNWQDQLYGYAYYLVGNENDAEDIVQEAFIRCYRALQQQDLHHPKAWLYRTVYNLTMDYRRKMPEQATVPLSYAIDIPQADDSELHAEYLRIERLLSLLSKEQADVVSLHFTEDLSFREIGEVLGISRNTAKTRYRLAMQHLKKYILQQ